MGKSLIVRALHATQGARCDVYTFFVYGEDLTRIADISRIERGAEDAVKGFQRREIRDHVKAIVNYLNQGSVIFPNAVILALSPEVRFVHSRGPNPRGLLTSAKQGTLTIPIRPEGKRVAWIVDGQQRSLALSKTKNKSLAVPVVAFVADSVATQREQFILVNKARPLPNRLINELLPEAEGIMLPKDLAVRKIPSELCNLLNRDRASPFFKLIKRFSDSRQSEAVVTDTAVIRMIKNSINTPLGALSPYRSTNDHSADVSAMYRKLLMFWSATKAAFPDAWGIPSTRSRLMHSAGIEAMGVLMDRIVSRHDGKANEARAIRDDLCKIAPSCAWITGTWETLGLAWNEVQNNPRHIRGLADALIRLYAQKVMR